MKRKTSLEHFLLAFIGLLIVLLNPVYAQSADISGSWKAEFDTQIGIQKYTFVFSETDSGITGTAFSDIGGEKQEVKLTEVKIDTNHIAFTEMLLFQGMELQINYEGTASGNEMKLNRNVGGFINEELVAKREEIPD